MTNNNFVGYKNTVLAHYETRNIYRGSAVNSTLLRRALFRKLLQNYAILTDVLNLHEVLQ